ncbi:hypothetical protein BCR42DRAFT_217354 [Absidia repens]|uniref:Uncharacterized protein n=1 Tax=Absidia repens TaxID=90262 RepID=A0A1X2IMX7_9FUNG|nr:hypothetical protein BCR42DRAFT_217354 [Absidia repens]
MMMTYPFKSDKIPAPIFSRVYFFSQEYRITLSIFANCNFVIVTRRRAYIRIFKPTKIFQQYGFGFHRSI